MSNLNPSQNLFSSVDSDETKPPSPSQELLSCVNSDETKTPNADPIDASQGPRL